MKYFAVVLFVTFGSCLCNSNETSNKVSSDDPDINGVTVTIPITEINQPSSPVPPTTTTTTPAPNPTTTTVKPTTPSTTKPTTVNPNATTTAKTTPKPTDKPTTKSTTVGPEPTSTTAPVSTTMSPHHHDRKFDGPSFVGGIILALGMVAIGFVAFKFYKARNELNYHTL